MTDPEKLEGDHRTRLNELALALDRFVAGKQAFGYGDKEVAAMDAASIRALLSRPAPVGREEVERNHARIKQMICDAMWSPASGPVVWTKENSAAMEAQAERLSKAIIAHLRTGGVAPPSPPSCEGLVREARFLLDRLSDLEGNFTSDTVAREYYGHVSPSAERLAILLQAFEDRQS